MYTTSNNILALNQPTQQGKQYTHHCEGKIITDYDHSLIVFHKRQFKQQQRKDIGKNMSLIYLHTATLDHYTFDTNANKRVLTRYQGFDENLGQKYYFLHQVHTNIIETLDTKQRGIHPPQLINQQYRITENLEAYETLNHLSLDAIITILYTTSLLYGKRDTRTINQQTHLRSITIQLPLISQNTSLIQRRTQAHTLLQEKGYFNTLSETINPQGSTIQYTISDADILEHIAGFDLANQYYITKKHSTAALKNQLIQYCQEHDVDTSLIENNHIKLLRTTT